jgi:hypothetical protein
MRTAIYSFVNNEASVLKHIAPTYFSVYSVVVVLHACVNGCSSRLCLVVADSPCFVYHTQIYGPVHGMTIHESNATMKLIWVRPDSACDSD